MEDLISIVNTKLLLVTKYLIYYHKACLSKLKEMHSKVFQFEYILTPTLLFLIHLNHLAFIFHRLK